MRLPAHAPCTFCGAPIHWGSMDRTGERLPIDPTPSPEGLLCHVAGRFVVWLPLLHGERDRYTPHEATCQGRP